LRQHPYDIKPLLPERVFRELIAPLLTGDQDALQLDTVHRRKDGSDFPVEVLLHLVRSNGKPNVFVNIVRDITERKQSEALIWRANQRVAIAAQAAGLGIWDYDPNSGDLVWDQAMFDLYYVAANEFEGVYAAWTSRVHPEDIQATAALLEAALRGEAQYDTSFRIVTREGEVRFLRAMASVERDPAGKALHMIGVNYDITEHKLAEQALADQVRHTQAILDNVIDGILTIDERGVVASCNQAAERIFGYAADQVVGNNVKMLMPEPYHSQHDGYLGNYLATDVARVIGIGREVTGLRKDGGTFPMDLAVSEISHHGKRLFVGLVRDITERKRVEQMKSEFVSTVSHESRTPLTSIAGALGLLVGGVLCAMPEAARPMLDIALKNSQRLTHLINDLLDMEKIAAGKLNFDMVVQPLMPLVEQALEANKAYGDQFGVRFELVAREDGAEVRVDSQRLMQVLSNFLSNAAKFSPQGQVVEIDVRREGVKIRVTVCDHGPGIPEEFRSHIFQKFAQADSSDTRQKDGTGLGLAITKELVEQMGGSVGFESIAGQGTRFHFDLPLFDGAAVPAATPGLQNNPDGSRILVVEDDADIAQVLALMLNRAGYRTDIANNGAQALDRLASQSYAAMTLDLMLPDMSGLEVIRRVRQQPATPPCPSSWCRPRWRKAASPSTAISPRSTGCPSRSTATGCCRRY